MITAFAGDQLGNTYTLVDALPPQLLHPPLVPVHPGSLVPVVGRPLALRALMLF